MESLSKETFLNIISHLHFRQKIECVLVCKQWEQWIRYTILYQDLNLYTRSMFMAAIGLFADNPKFSKQVHNLRLRECEPDTYYMLLIPEIFSNAKKLIWESRHPLKSNPPRKPVCIQQFQNWKALEDVSCYSEEYSHIVMYTLESTVLPRLTKLAMQTYESTAEPKPILYNENLFTRLQNAPALTELTIGGLSMSISDLNTLHEYTPNLQTLYLRKFFLDDVDKPAAFTVSSNLINFSVDLHLKKYKDMEEKNMTKTIKSLLSFVTTKYSALQKLAIRFNSEYSTVPIIGPVEGDIIRTIRQLPHLKSYSIKLHPITDMIMEAMDDAQIKLEEIEIWLQEFDTRRQLNFLLDSKQINSISRLSIIDIIDSERAISNCTLIFNLVSNLQNITVLDISTQCDATSYTYEFLIRIIHEFNNLETLRMTGIYDDNLELATVLSTDQPKRSKLTTLRLELTGENHRHHYTNTMFEFIFQSCPSLKTFYLSGTISFTQYACISLDLSRHTLLKDVSISLGDVAYYTREKEKPNVPCVMYKSISKELKLRPDDKLMNTFYIELLCNTGAISWLGIAYTQSESDPENIFKSIVF